MRVERMRPSQSKYVKRLKRNEYEQSLKQVARQAAARGDQNAADWLFNKVASTKKESQGIGSTRRKKPKQVQNRPGQRRN